MHVLIIEDEPIIAMSIEDELRDCGCASFDLAASVDQAVAAARLRCPDLITADVQLAPGCGIEAVAAICGAQPIPVIFITSEPARIHARRPGAIIVRKPFHKGQIRQALALALAAVPGRPAQPSAAIPRLH